MRFYIADLEGLLDRVPGGGLIVVPSAPVMSRLVEDEAHREALEGADFAVTDSAFMVLLWLLRTGLGRSLWVNKVSPSGQERV